MTPQERLRRAIMNGRVFGVKAAIKDGASVLGKGDFFHSPIKAAVQKYSPHILAVLIKEGANVNENLMNGWRPLHLAALNDLWGESMCAMLLAHGARVNVKTQSGLTPLHLASWAHNHGAVRLLLSFGARVDAQNDAGHTPLYCSLGFYGKEDAADTIRTVVELLRAGANPDIADKFGATARGRVEDLYPEHPGSKEIKALFK